MTDLSFQGKNVLITGGSSETGPFICREFADVGANVAATWFSNRSGLEATGKYVREQGVDFFPFHLDLLDQASIDQLIRDVQETWSQLDVLVLCCGTKGLRPFQTLSREQLDTAVDGNVKGNFMLAHRLGYWMKTQPDSLGKIIQLTAMSAENATHSAYGLAKAAQNSMADFLALNLAPNVTINTIAPITIEQDPSVTAPPPDPAPLGRRIHAREIARMCRLLCDPAFATVTGELIRMDSGRHVGTAYPKEL
ncbi:MAG: SDR family oxidoreductase [Planctomycetia bacterium]|jgi:NAD(P)-dependent dehydrogenase (short-subunit alcohol dehydrogenase family)